MQKKHIQKPLTIFITGIKKNSINIILTNIINNLRKYIFIIFTYNTIILK